MKNFFWKLDIAPLPLSFLLLFLFFFFIFFFFFLFVFPFGHNLEYFHPSMKNMERILWTCWTACFPLYFLTPETIVLLRLEMLLVLPLFTWAGVLMVCNFYYCNRLIIMISSLIFQSLIL